MLEFETDGAEQALATLDAAAGAARAAHDDELRALTWSLRATVLGRSGRTREARAAVDRALPHADLLAPRDRIILHMNRGLWLLLDGDLHDAEPDLVTAAELAEQHELTDERFMALHNLGYLRHLLGDVPAALDAMQQADAIDVDISRGISLLDRGRVLLEAGLVDEAHALLTESVAVSRADGQQQTVAEAQYELAVVAQLRGELEDAIAQVDAAAAAFDERSARGWVLRCRLSVLLLRLRQAHLAAPARPGAVDRQEARTLARQARQLVSEAADGGPGLARLARVVASEAAAFAGDVAAAAQVLPEPDPAAVPLLTSRLDEQRARTTLALARDDVAGARRALEAAADDLAVTSRSATTLDLRTARLAHGAVLATTDLALALDDGPVATLQVVDRWRACSTRLPPVRPATTPQLEQLLARRRQLREHLRDTPDVDGAVLRSLADVEDRIAEVRRGDAGRAGAVPDRWHVDDVRAAPVDDVLAALADDDRDLLVTLEHGGEVLAVSAVDGTPAVHHVGPVAEIKELARRILTDLQVRATLAPGPFTNRVESSLLDQAETLAHRLLGPGAGRSGRLLVCSHGALSSLPWGLLAPDRPVVLSSSPSAWLRSLRGHAAAGSSATVRIVRGPRLAAATEEAAAVAAAWDVDAPRDIHPTSALAEAMTSAEVVHVIAHGEHHHQQPLFSSLAMGDGPCSLYDLEVSGVRARQVVLAACDAARVSLRPGDEPLGLAVGLLALGARSVVAPVAPVPDELLPEVMGRLHRAIADGVPTDEALVAATEGAPLAARAFVVAGSAQRGTRVATGHA